MQLGRKEEKKKKKIFHFFVFFLSVVVDPYGGTALPSRLLYTTSTSPQCNAVQHTQLDTTESARFTRLEREGPAGASCVQVVQVLMVVQVVVHPLQLFYFSSSATDGS
jgi:hypothetical protein